MAEKPLFSVFGGFFKSTFFFNPNDRVWGSELLETRRINPSRRKIYSYLRLGLAPSGLSEWL